MATIQSIKMYDTYDAWLGYALEMSDASKNIVLKISNDSQCCEQFGIHNLPKNMDEFIGAQYHSVTVQQIPGTGTDGDPMATKELLVCTDRGTITLQVYNSHNGYYPHDIVVKTEHGELTDAI